MNRPVAVAAGLLVDRFAGEPPTAWHPTAWFGTAMGAVEGRIHADRRRNGVAYCAVGVAMGTAAGMLVRRLLGPGLATAVATGLSVAGRMLDDEATAIGGLLGEGRLDEARLALRALVGRSAVDLDAAEIARAVIESVAENTVDAVTAAAFWALVGGAPGVLAYRAINTMDAMVGHRNERYRRFGWASARLDDAANWVPARLTAALALAPLVRTPAARQVVEAVLAQARAHPSPNGGVIEAAYAHRLGITLGGTNRYGDRVEHRGLLGVGPAPGADDIGRTVALRRALTLRIGMALTVAGVVRAGRRRRSRLAP